MSMCHRSLNNVPSPTSSARWIAALRDALLPKLISGELRISDADAILAINDTPVPIGGGTPEEGKPSFRNTLSSGDRNTLALAFFFASFLGCGARLHHGA
jgi:hypothetical protein